MSNRQILTLLLFSFALGLSAQDKKISVISIEKVNTVYRGIMNPIKIAVPGSKSFKAEAYGSLVKIDSLGNYNWNVTSVAGTKGLIRIDAVMSDNSLMHEEKVFEIRVINQLKTTLDLKSYNRSSFELTKDEILKARIDLKIDDFSYNLVKLNVNAFEIFFPNKESLIVYGNRFDTIAANKVEEVSNGEHIRIQAFPEYNIKTESIDITVIDNFKPNPIVAFKNRNVLYRKVDNQLDIAVPGAKSFTASAPGLRANNTQSYSWNVSKIKTNIAYLTFEITTENDSVFSTTEMFYVEDLKPIRATINDRGCDNCIVELEREEVKEAKIGIDWEDTVNTNIQKIFYIKGFLLELPDGNLYRVGEGKFSESAQKMILQFPNGAIFKISEIEFSSHGYIASPKMKFTLVDKYE